MTLGGRGFGALTLMATLMVGYDTKEGGGGGPAIMTLILPTISPLSEGNSIRPRNNTICNDIQGTDEPDDGCTDSSFRGIINYCSSNSSQGCSLTREGIEAVSYIMSIHTV